MGGFNIRAIGLFHQPKREDKTTCTDIYRLYGVFFTVQQETQQMGTTGYAMGFVAPDVQTNQFYFFYSCMSMILSCIYVYTQSHSHIFQAVYEIVWVIDSCKISIQCKDIPLCKRSVLLAFQGGWSRSNIKTTASLGTRFRIMENIKYAN